MNYYNEFDPKAAAWLRELITAGLIPKGDVDERSISEVRPNDLWWYCQCHFFAGIGGWSLALKLAGWPEDRPVWTGSCPCQPFSAAGKRRCARDARHLWPKWVRLIAECNGLFRVPTIFGEQVASADGRIWLSGVRSSMAHLGYRFGAADLCAAGVGAPHIRQRLYWVADSWRSGFDKRCGGYGDSRSAWLPGSEPESIGIVGVAGECEPRRLADDDDEGLQVGQANGIGPDSPAAAVSRRDAGWPGDSDEQGRSQQSLGLVGPVGEGHWSDYELLPCLDGKMRRTKSGIFPLAHGVSGRVGLLRGAGNAIVPQVAAEFIAAFLETKTMTTQ